MQTKRTYYPLTKSQRTVLPPLFFPRHEDVFVRMLFSVAEECDVGALEKAFLHLVETQDALRLRLHFGWRGLSQYVTDAEPLSVPVVALRDESELDAAVQERYGMLKNPLFGGALYRAVIFTYDGHASLFVIFSHLCFDGYSFALTYKLLKEYYLAYANGEEPKDLPKRYSYTDYCKEDMRYNASERKAEDLAYWRALFRQKPYMSGFLPPFSLRAVYSPFKTQNRTIKGELRTAVIEFCRSCGVSVPYFLTATAALTAKYLTGKEKIMFVGQSHGRSTVLQKRLIGMMVDAFPIIFDLSDAQTLTDYYTSGYLSYLEDVKHSKASIYRAILGDWKLWIKQRYFPTCSEVFSGTLGFSMMGDDPQFPFRFVLPHYFFAQFYLLFFDDYIDGAFVSASYQSLRYSEERISQLLETYCAIAASVVSRPEQTVAELVRSVAESGKIDEAIGQRR